MTNNKTPTSVTAKSIMADAGIPSHVIEFVLGKNPSRLFDTLFTFFLIFLMAIGFAVGAVLWIILAQVSDRNAISFAKSVGALLYEDIYGISMLCLLFAWIFSMSLISEFFERSFPKIGVSLFVFSHLDQKNLQWRRYREFLASIRNVSDPREFLIEVSKRKSRWALVPMLALVALSAFWIERELDSYSAFTEKSYYSKPILPWRTEASGDWVNAKKVELGCNHITGKNASDDIIYEVWISDDLSFRLSSATVIEGNRIEHLERIDATLRQADVSFQRWKWMERDPLHPLCLEAQKRFYSQDELIRIFRLLRVGEFPGDAKTN